MSAGNHIFNIFYDMLYVYLAISMRSPFFFMKSLASRINEES